MKLIGRTVLPGSLAYALTVGARRSEVVVLPPAIFRRSPGQAWHKAAAAARSSSPLDGLLGILKDLSPTTVVGGRSVAGTLTTNQARTLGILNVNVISALTTVVVDLDTAGHITGFRLTSRGSRSGAPVSVEQRAQFGSFDHAVAIAAPR